MNKNDGSSNEWDGSPAGAHDPLADRLRREAMAERPPFSRELHRQILNRVRNEPLVVNSPRRIGFRQWLTAAAAIFVASALAWSWIVRSHRAPVPKESTTVGNNIPHIPDAQPPEITTIPASTALKIDFAGILSARFFPPEITVRLPMVNDDASSEQPQARPVPPATFPGSPDWLLARLQEPATSATAALADVMPPELRDLEPLAVKILGK